MKIILCMGYWEGDRELAFEVTAQAGKLLGDKSDSIGLCYVYRRDSSPPPTAIMDRDRKYFAKVYSKPTQYDYTGWPGGCNAISYTVLNYVLPESEKTVEAALILESDCVITRKGWDVEILAEWDKAVKEHKSVVGAVLPWAYHNGHSHVNASALWGRKTNERIGGLKNGKPKNLAWDYYYGSNSSLLAMNSPLFRLDWKRETITAKELFGSGALIYHGVKDDSARSAVKEKYNL